MFGHGGEGKFEVIFDDFELLFDFFKVLMWVNLMMIRRGMIGVGELLRL